MAKVYKNTRAGVDAIFTDGITGSETDPDAVSFKTQAPAGGITTYVFGTDEEVSRISAGVYRFIFLPNAAGDWFVYGIGSGTVDAVNKIKLPVLDTPF